MVLSLLASQEEQWRSWFLEGSIGSIFFFYVHSHIFNFDRTFFAVKTHNVFFLTGEGFRRPQRSSIHTRGR
jgi:hypothetical protein